MKTLISRARLFNVEYTGVKTTERPKAGFSIPLDFKVY
jgi:hypothetical protein